MSLGTTSPDTSDPGVGEVPQDDDELRKKTRTLRRLAHFQLLYAVFTMTTSLVTMLIGFAFANESILFPELQTIGHLLLALGGYGFIAAAIMLKARNQLLELSTRATIWNRAALGFAVPGSLIAAAFGVFALSRGHTLTSVIGFTLIAAALLNILALARGAFSDLDDALWVIELSRHDLSNLNYE